MMGTAGGAVPFGVSPNHPPQGKMRRKCRAFRNKPKRAELGTTEVVLLFPSSGGINAVQSTANTAKKRAAGRCVTCVAIMRIRVAIAAALEGQSVKNLLQ